MVVGLIYFPVHEIAVRPVNYNNLLTFESLVLNNWHNFNIVSRSIRASCQVERMKHLVFKFKLYIIVVVNQSINQSSVHHHRHHHHYLILQEGAVAHKAEDSCNPLGQAYIKYLDALSLEEGVATNNFHAGRLLVMQGNYEDAVKRLEAALCWNQKYQLAR